MSMNERNGGLVRKRGCKVCKIYFRPNPRVGDRQKTCGKDECKKEWRKRKNQEAYRKSRGYHRGIALRKKLASEESERKKPAKAGPAIFDNLDLPREDIREMMGLEALVVLEYLVRLIFRHIRSPNKGRRNMNRKNTIKRR